MRNLLSEMTPHATVVHRASLWAVTFIVVGMLDVPGADHTGWTIEESFGTTIEHPAGSALNGKPFEDAPSGTKWKAGNKITLARGGYAAYDGSEAQTNATATVPILHDASDDAIYTLTADILLKDSLFMAIGLLSDHRGFFQDGQVWLMVRHGGKYTLIADGMDTEDRISNKPGEAFNYREKNRVTLIYDSGNKTVTVKYNGRVALEDHDLSPFADEFNIARVGFAHYTGAEATSKDVHEVHGFKLNITDPTADAE